MLTFAPAPPKQHTMLPQMIAFYFLGNKTGKGKGNVIRHSPPGGFKKVITHLGNGTVSVNGISGVKCTAFPSMLSSLKPDFWLKIVFSRNLPGFSRKSMHAIRDSLGFSRKSMHAMRDSLSFLLGSPCMRYEIS